MDAHATTTRTNGVPWLAWLFVVGAAAQLAVQVAPDSYQVFGPYFLVDAGTIVDWVHSISLFLLAAAVVMAADRWPAGRRTLVIGASVLAASALLRLGVDLWWALSESTGGFLDPTSPWLSAGSLSAALLFDLALGILAVGLWTTRSNRPMARARSAVAAVIMLGGAVATTVALWGVVQALGMVPSDSRAYAITISVVIAGGFAALTLLAIAALRAGRHPDGMPETLIAAGAVIVMVAGGWRWSFSNVVPLQEVPEEAFVWVFTLPHMGEVFGWLTMIGGFGLAALAVRRGTAGDDPAA